MIYIPPIPQLGVHGVVEPGVPNRERICFRPTEPVNLAFFGVLLTRKDPSGFVTPMRNQFFWFGEKEIAPPCWVMLLTGKGEPRVIVEGKHPIHLYFWNKDYTIFQTPEIIPIIFRIGSFTEVPILPPPEKIQQLNTPKQNPITY